MKKVGIYKKICVVVVCEGGGFGEFFFLVDKLCDVIFDGVFFFDWVE